MRWYQPSLANCGRQEESLGPSDSERFWGERFHGNYCVVSSCNFRVGQGHFESSQTIFGVIESPVWVSSEIQQQTSVHAQAAHIHSKRPYMHKQHTYTSTRICSKCQVLKMHAAASLSLCNSRRAWHPHTRMRECTSNSLRLSS